MNQDKELDIAEGADGQLAKNRLGEKVWSLPENQFRETALPKDTDMPKLDKNIFIIIAILTTAGIIMAVYSLKHAAMVENSYKSGFSEGAASVGSSLALTKREMSGYTEQINQLQNNLGQSNDNVIKLQKELDKNMRELALVKKQKDRLAQDLKETKESYSGRIASLKQSYEKKIDRIVQEDEAKIKNLLDRPQQKKIDTLSSQLSSTQTALATAQKEVQDKSQLLSQLQENVNQYRSQIALFQEQMTKTAQELNQQKAIVDQSMKEAQTPYYGFK